jgi:hypothetical protein
MLRSVRRKKDYSSAVLLSKFLVNIDSFLNLLNWYPLEILCINILTCIQMESNWLAANSWEAYGEEAYQKVFLHKHGQL